MDSPHRPPPENALVDEDRVSLDAEWEERLGRYRSYLRLLALREIPPKLRAKVDASDIVQQTLIEACESRERLRDRSEGERLVWLRTALAHNLGDELRRYGRARRNVDLERSIARTTVGLEALISARVTSPSGCVIREEEAAGLADALSRLPDGQREAVELHHLEGLPLSEVAERMGRSAPAVAGLIHRGLRALRELLDGRSGP